MNQAMPDLTTESLVPPSTDSLGAWLRAHRLQRQMSLADVSESTKYHAKQLESLENNHWESLPSGFVLRSIVKKFAKAVGADEAKALERLAQETGNSVVSPDTKNLRTNYNLSMNEQLPDNRRGSGAWVWILVILVLLVGAGYIAYDQGMVSAEDIEFISNWFN